MSYCRTGEDSDVYVFGTTDGCFECCRCLMEVDYGSFKTQTIEGMLCHLVSHIRLGHKVPLRAFAKLINECKPEMGLKNGDKVKFSDYAKFEKVCEGFSRRTGIVTGKNRDGMVGVKIDGRVIGHYFDGFLELAKPRKADEISVCEKCLSITHTVDGKCGKCGHEKEAVT